MKNTAHMKRFALLVAGCWIMDAAAQAPQAINYQGRLIQGTNLYNGTASVVFRLYTNSVGGTHHFESTNLVTVVDGLYATSIGQFVTLGTLDDALTRAQNWLEVSVNGSTLSPRERILSVPYARQTHGLRVTGANSIILNPGGGNVAAVNAQHASIGGGLANSIAPNADYATIGGGDLNVISNYGYASVIAGGQDNTIQTGAYFSAIGGGFENTLDENADDSTIAGGAFNWIQTNSVQSAIGGGRRSVVDSDSTSSTIAGGLSNRIGRSAGGTAIGGGQLNVVQTGAQFSVIGGGSQNTIQTGAYDSVIGGGEVNIIERGALGSTVGGGILNVIGSNALYGTIPGGYQNQLGINAFNAFAAGRQAKALHPGAFVWADNTVADYASTAANEFSVRATGGVRLSDNTPSLSFGSTTRQMLNLWSTNYGIGIQAFGFYCRTDGNFYWYKGGQHDHSTGNAGGGLTLMSLTTDGLTVNGTFVSSSDRNHKTDLQPVDSRAVLDGVVNLPLATWRFVHDTNTLHLGPMAQDFRAAFGLGPDDRHITMVDADGVALAAIQALAKENAALGEQVSAFSGQVSGLKSENVQLRRENEALKSRLDAIERKLGL